MANLTIKALENNFTNNILDEYMELVLTNGPVYHWYYSKNKTFSDNFFYLIGSKDFVQKVISGTLPISFEFFKLLCKEFHRFGYDYSHLRKILPKSKKDAFLFFENFPRKTIENKKIISHLEKDKLLNLIEEKDKLGSLESEIIDLAFYSYLLDYEKLKHMIKKYNYTPSYSGLFHKCAYNWIKSSDLGVDETYSTIKNKAEDIKNKLIEDNQKNILSTLFNISSNKIPLFPGYSNSYPSPIISIDYNYSNFWFIENSSGGKIRDSYDYQTSSRISEFSFETNQEYKYSPIYPFLDLDDQKKFIDDFFVSIDTFEFEKEASERSHDINTYLKFFYTEARNKKDIKKYLASKLFDKSVLDEKIITSLFKEDDFILFLFIADKDIMDYIKTINLEFLQLIFLKFKKTYYFYCKLYKTDILAKKRKAEQFCYGNIYEDKCMICVHYPEKNLSGVNQCKMNYENALDIELKPDDRRARYGHYRKISTFKIDK